MDCKILPLLTIPDHPKYLRLPSLSRSLVHSILPRACQAMQSKPLVFSVSTNPLLVSGPPNFTTRVRKLPKPAQILISKPKNAQPNSPSYTYKKMFVSKPLTPLPKHKYYKSKKSLSLKPNYTKTYYCEINNFYSKTSTKSLTPVLSTTLYNFKPNSYWNSLENVIDNTETPEKNKKQIKKHQIMKNISEVRSSQESSNESLKYFHIKNSST
jgi:hypothetical protein